MTKSIEYLGEFEPKKRLKLEIGDFNGPLDMLLAMVKDAEIEIKDIFISKVTDQFIEYITSLEELDVDIGSEYMEMTATLMEIKSRALLPVVMDEIDDIDPEQELIRRLDEYRLLKEASEKLKEKENVDRLYKAPDKSDEEIRYIAADMSLNNLLDAYVKLLARIEMRRADVDEPKEIVKDVFTVEDKIKYIKDRLVFESRVGFFELFEEYASKTEIVVTFSALLELIKLQFIKVKQAKDFGDIDIVRYDAEYNIGSE